MKTSEAFRLTKEKLWDGTQDRVEETTATVCRASEKANVAAIVMPIVMKLLSPSFYLSSWLMHNHNIVAWRDTKRYQQTRHAWVDHLIEHYESIGD